MTGKKKKGSIDYFNLFCMVLETSLYAFFSLFFVFYISKYGITNLVLIGGTKHEILFNIGLWFVIVMYCLDKFFINLREWANKEWKKK